jgi:hypothetical protein
MPNEQIGADQAQEQTTENAGPVLFSKLGVSPIPIRDFDPVGKPVSELLKHLEQTAGLVWQKKQITITRDGANIRVDESAIVRPGDYVQINDKIKNN